MYHVINTLYRDHIKNQIQDWLLAGDTITTKNNPNIARAVSYHPHYNAVDIPGGKQVIGMQNSACGSWTGIAPRVSVSPQQLLYEYRLCRPYTKQQIVSILQEGDNAVCGDSTDLIEGLRQLKDHYHVVENNDGVHIVGVNRGVKKRKGWVGVAPTPDYMIQEHGDDLHNEIVRNHYNLWTYRKKNHVADVIKTDGVYTVHKEDNLPKYLACQRVAQERKPRYTIEFTDDCANIRGVCGAKGKWFGKR